MLCIGNFWGAKQQLPISPTLSSIDTEIRLMLSRSQLITDAMLHRLAVLCTLLFGLVYHPSAAQASETCSIELNGLLFHHGYCSLSKESDGVLLLTPETADPASNYDIVIKDLPDGSFEVHWQGTYGANVEFDQFAGTTKLGDCYRSEQVSICLNVSTTDTPLYEVVDSTPPEYGTALIATVNGTKYRINHPSWQDMRIELGVTKDLDGDGFPETIIETFSGGNCCPGGLTVVSYRGDGFFHVVNEERIWRGWDGYKVIQRDVDSIIRVFDKSLGVANNENQRTQTDYALRDGKLVKLVERKDNGEMLALAELTVTEVEGSRGQSKKLNYDIDLDGQNDVVECRYWQRWGMLSCNISYTATGTVEDMSCKRLAVLPEVYHGRLRVNCE